MTNERFQRTMIRAVLGIVALWAMATAASAQENFYVASHAATLSSAADTITVQQPANSSSTRARNIKFRGALVRCSVNCTITLSQNGTAATTTALTVTPLNLSPPSAAVAFSGSNVGAGTTIQTYAITQTGDYWIDLSIFTLARGSGSNLSIGTSSISGTSNIAIFFSEI